MIEQADDQILCRRGELGILHQAFSKADMTFVAILGVAICDGLFTGSEFLFAGRQRGFALGEARQFLFTRHSGLLFNLGKIDRNRTRIVAIAKLHGAKALDPGRMGAKEPARAAAPEATLRLALSAYVGTAKVGKRGVQWKNGRYWSPALVQWQDRMVVLRRDEEDLGALFIFDEDDNYIDTAVNAERSGLSEQEFAMWARGHQKRALDEAKAEIKRKQKRYPMDRAVTEMLREEAALAGKVAFFPIPTVEHVTPAMASMAVPPAFVVDQPPNDTARRDNKPDAPARTLSVEERVARADAIILAHRQGEAVDPSAFALSCRPVCPRVRRSGRTPTRYPCRR